MLSVVLGTSAFFQILYGARQLLTERSSIGLLGGSGIRSASASATTERCSQPRMIPANVRPVACCISSMAVNMDIAASMVPKLIIPSSAGTANCPALCRWSIPREKPPVASFPWGAACWCLHGATIESTFCRFASAVRATVPISSRS